MNKKFNKDQEQFIKDNYLNMTYSEIAKTLGNFTDKQVRTWASQNGLRKNRVINGDYFNNIDTPLKAYLLGFIFADGWISKNSHNSYEFGMELQSADKYILEKINSELGNQNIIYHSKPYSHKINGIETVTKDMDCLRVYSKPLVNGLIANGIVFNKTKKDVFPIVDNNLFFDFLRGYIDGDGCYYKCKNNTYMHITCASLKPLRYIQNKLYEFEIQTNIYSEKENKHRLMCVNSESMKKLINQLYYEADLFCLKRKYEKIKHLIGFAT